MIALHAGNLSNGGTGVYIQNDDLRPMRQVRTPGTGIHGDVIEILTTALRGPKRDFLQQVIAGTWCSDENESTDAETAKSND